MLITCMDAYDSKHICWINIVLAIVTFLALQYSRVEMILNHLFHFIGFIKKYRSEF